MSRATEAISDAEWQRRWPNFPKSDWRCQETGELDMSIAFLDKLQQMRTELGFPLPVTSGFRSQQHSLERHKASGGGRHTQGIAVDISAYSARAYDILAAALKAGFYGVGVSQRQGRPRFLHLDLRPFAERTLYSY